jgi:hypothetical protein
MGGGCMAASGDDISMVRFWACVGVVVPGNGAETSVCVRRRRRLVSHSMRVDGILAIGIQDRKTNSNLTMLAVTCNGW